MFYKQFYFSKFSKSIEINLELTIELNQDNK